MSGGTLHQSGTAPSGDPVRCENDDDVIGELVTLVCGHGRASGVAASDLEPRLWRKCGGRCVCASRTTLFMIRMSNATHDFAKLS